MGDQNGNGGYMLSARCKILTILSMIVVCGEIVSVYRWEKTFYIQETTYYKTPKDVLTGINENLTSFKDETVTALLVNKVILSTTSSPTTITVNQSIPQLAEDKEIPGASNLPQVQRLPSGALQISKELQEQLDRRLKAATDKKVILVWIPMFGGKPRIEIDAAKCGNCELSYDRGKINDGDVGAVVFHFDALNAKNMPAKRNPNHLYIFWDIESTATLRVVRGHSLKFEDSFKFNATLTYRRDSDFYQSYDDAITVVEIVEQNNLSPEDLLKLKTKMAVAIVSNCGYTPGARTRIKMLKELMGLNFGFEGFGACFKGPRFAGGAGRGAESFKNEVRKYKFYFSFENTRHCKDYITEKFFNNALKPLAVPVVWGAKKEDYQAVSPPGSFIFADDFSSMKDLSEYLKNLDKNDTAYLEYFKWLTMKPSDMPQYGRTRSWCNICRALHGINIDDIYNPKFDENNMKRPLFTDGIANRTVDHLIQWYYDEDNPECFNR